MVQRGARAALSVIVLGSWLSVSCSSESAPEAAGGRAGVSGGGRGGSGGGDGGESGGSGGGSRSGGSPAAGAGPGSPQAGSGGTSEPGAACEPIRTFETEREPLRRLHVATSGSSTGTGTEQDPFADIETAVAAAEPGTAIVVHAGDYGGDQFISDVVGTEQAPIWIGGAAGEERPVIGEAGNAEALHVSGARYLVLHDLVITGSTANGINLDDRGDYADAEVLRHVIVRNVRFDAIGSGGNNDCLKLSGANDFFVLDSEFIGCSAGGSNIDHVGCHDGLIAGNSFEGGGTGVQTKGGSHGITILGNVFRRGGGRAVNMGGATGFEFFRPPLDATGENYEARDIRVIANVFDRVAEVAAMPGCVDCLFAHNTVYRPVTRILRILQETTTSGGFTFLPAQGGRVVNNVFFYMRAEITGGGRAINVGAGTNPGTFHYSNNSWYAADDVEMSAEVDYQSDRVEGTVPPADPLFTDPTNGEFRLRPGSPLIGRGTALAEAPRDHAGRCYRSPPTLGAFESVP